LLFTVIFIYFKFIKNEDALIFYSYFPPVTNMLFLIKIIDESGFNLKLLKIILFPYKVFTSNKYNALGYLSNLIGRN